LNTVFAPNPNRIGKWTFTDYDEDLTLLLDIAIMNKRQDNGQCEPDERLIVSTPELDIEVLQWNARASKTMVLTHGWPDSAEGWGTVAKQIAHAGWRVLAPSLRGFGSTRFRHATSPRSGQLAALGRDMLALIQAMQLKHPVLVGHDWGARAVANAVGLAPSVASHLVLLSIGYGTNHPDQALGLEQAKRYWYHWYMATARGEQTVRDNGKAFARIMWDTWSPAGWYTEKAFEQAARAFENPDWADITLHSYRHRWANAEGFTEYDPEEKKLHPAPQIAVPTLIIHGQEDYCNHPDVSAGKESYFEGRYERVLLEGVGHFPQRENPDRVAREIMAFCQTP
jgi:pimeloyl-ACP methyl ester carboxylesterase